MERFVLLGERAPQEGLRRFYRSLVASERGHYKAFLELASLLPDARESLDTRWDTMLDAEGEIIQRQAPASRMHGGL